MYILYNGVLRTMGNAEKAIKLFYIERDSDQSKTFALHL